MEVARTRTRDPDRKQRILASAAALCARRGFHAISMADIGADAGIAGSGIYRHFDSKTSILTAMLDKVMTRLADGTAEIIATQDSPGQALAALVSDHIAVALADRDILAVYHMEAHNLPEADLYRLRRSQRHYVEEWVHLLAPLRPDLADAELRLAVHAAIGAIQSTLFFRSGLDDARLAGSLRSIALACMGTGRDQPAPQ
jgi:AcrR family transcriptional regulator